MVTTVLNISSAFLYEFVSFVVPEERHNWKKKEMKKKGYPRWQEQDVAWKRSCYLKHQKNKCEKHSAATEVPQGPMLRESFEWMYQGEPLKFSFGVLSWLGLSLRVSQHGGCRVGKSRQVEYEVICQELHHMGRWQVSQQGLRMKQVGRENKKTMVSGQCLIKAGKTESDHTRRLRSWIWFLKLEFETVPRNLRRRCTGNLCQLPGNLTANMESSEWRRKRV